MEGPYAFEWDILGDAKGWIVAVWAHQGHDKVYGVHFHSGMKPRTLVAQPYVSKPTLEHLV